MGDKSTYAITAGSQHTDGHSLVITQVTLKSTGWVAVHTDANGAPGVVIGVSSLLAPGTHDNVVVRLSKAQSAGTKVMPVVHVEDNNNTTFDYPKGDAPATIDGRVVVVTISLT